MTTETQPDAAEIAQAWTEIGERSRRVVEAFLQHRAGSDGFQIPDPNIVGRAFMEAGQQLMAHPAKLAEVQMAYWQGMMQLWQNQMRRMAGEEVEPLLEPDKGDRRFKDDAWTEEPVFDFIKQSYLLISRCLQDTLSDVEGLDAKTRDKVAFYTRQYVDAMSPTNFVATNPRVLREAVESKGDNLVRGLENLLADYERGEGELRIRMTDENAFELGRDIATAPGKVVYQNDLMQLLQYAPSTETVHQRPLLIVPPWINKFYILDLRERNSFIRWATAQGFTVFVISWVNPDARLAAKTFEHYMLEGPVAAMDAIEQATGEREITIIGYCLGGTLTACLLSWMAAKGDTRIKAATFFTAMTDFSEPGDLSVFIDEDQLSALEEHMQDKGYLEGRHMARVFNLLRSNDLIWNFVVNNYLMGRDPPPFDLLYWNADSTRMPAMMHGFYLRNCYLENKVIEPGAITLAGESIDLGAIKTPCYFLSAREDHIAPWHATYLGAKHFGGPVRFVLGASGHIAGVVNPPVANKYGYWLNARRPADPEAWLEKATWHEGSWWPDWAAWLAKKSGKQVPARDPATGGLKPIEDAPGSYVKVRAPD